MLEDAKFIPPNIILECDVCVLGAGPAGITIGHELVGTSRSVILLAGGGTRETEEWRALNRGFSWPPGSHEPLERNRRRQFGGASAVWGGRCVPLDPIDFEERSWVPFSGWPLTSADLASYIIRATKLCEAGEAIYNASSLFLDRQSEIIAGFDGPDVFSWPLERWGPPTHFAKRYGPALRKALNVRVLLNASGVHLQLEIRQQDLPRRSRLLCNASFPDPRSDSGPGLRSARECSHTIGVK